MSYNKQAKIGIAGFTLVELLLVMVIIGLIMVAAAGAIRSGARHLDGTVDRLAAMDRTVRVQTLLRALLENAQINSLGVEPEKNGNKFTGRQDEIAFTYGGPEIAGIVPGSFLRLLLRRQGHRHELVLSSGRDTARNEPGFFGDDIVLISDIGVGAFSYYGNSESCRKEWCSTWSEATHFPALVRLSISPAATRGVPWPDFVVHLRIHENSNCIFDSVLKSCRGA